MNEIINEWIHEINEMNGMTLDEWMDAFHKWMDAWMHEWITEWMNAWLNEGNYCMTCMN